MAIAPSPSRQLLEQAVTEGDLVNVVFSEDHRELRARLLSVDAQGVRVEILDGSTGIASGLVVHVRANTESRNFSFWSRTRTARGGVLQLAAPARVQLRQRRASPRVAAPPDATVLFAIGERVFRRPILDLAGSGLGVVLQPDDPLEAGQVFERVRFSLPIGAPIFAAARVQHVRDTEAGRIAGIDLSALLPEDARRLDAWARSRSRTRSRPSATAIDGLSATVSLPGLRSRTRSVLQVGEDMLLVALGEPDRDLREGDDTATLELWAEGVFVAGGAAIVDEVVRHRGRPLHATLTWTALRPEQAARVARLVKPAS